MSEPLTQTQIDNMNSSAFKGWQKADTQLQDLLLIIFGANGERVENSIGLTVMVGGATISGLAVPHGTWHKKFAESLEQASPGFGDAMEKMKAASDAVSADMREKREENDLITPPAYYLHFNECYIFADGGRTPIKSGPWRVTLDKVDAWHLGSHTEPDDE